MSKKEVLYVGMDESNHGEIKSRIGEIIVASYSVDESFWEIRQHPNRRNYSRVNECLKEGVKYTFTIVSHEMAKENYSNLHLVAPFLVREILKGEEMDSVKLGFDGRLERSDRKNLLDKLSVHGTDFSVRNFTKSKGVHKCPELIYLSHQIANNILNKSMLEIARDENYTPFS